MADAIPITETALLLCDLQNDFIHPKGAYARGGQSDATIAALPTRLAPLCQAMRTAGGWIASTHFTLVPGKGGEPFIAEHLKQMRPFLRKGDFAPASWGQALVDELAPSDLMVEKIGYDAFWNSRLEWALRKAGIRALLVAGIVTNGGVASTVRGAHVREFDVTVLEDGCAAFSSAIHQAAIDGLRPVARITSIEQALQEITGK
jgi:nicotinamidase-related amidase